MLVLSRFENEFVNIYQRTADGVKPIGKVCLVEIRGNKCRLGFDFPAEFAIARDEVDELKSKREAAKT